ncbi:MAG: Uma2 family endonuclease [Clostridia bacterium]|nr:MAG: Uma2 family endonuclease [Clostridia bacterium]
MGMPQEEIKLPARETYTYTDYALLPEGAPYQLIGGKLIMTPAPTTFHQIVSGRLESALRAWVTARDLGLVIDSPVDVYLEEAETYQPDIIFIARERLDIVEEARVNGAPDLVVEILSPSTAYYDLRKKARTYASYGVKEYWVADPAEKSLELYTNHEGSFILEQRVEGEGQFKSLLLPGLAVEVREVFASFR